MELKKKLNLDNLIDLCNNSEKYRTLNDVKIIVADRKKLNKIAISLI